MTGVQYTLGATGLRGGTQLGALRNGGFDQARIGSGSPYRISNATGTLRAKVPVVASPVDVTSAHIAMTENGLTNPGIAWGNGALNSGAGPAVTLGCASCHNPHGNGKYRILNPVPSPTGLTPVAAPGVSVTDAALPPAGDTRNYTVIQTPTTAGYLLLASQVTAGGYASTAGDYFHRRVPWDGTGNMDAPNGLPASFNAQMTQYCSACHTRYFSTLGELDPSGDDLYKYQHHTSSDRACTTCHVAHGSNASMGPDLVTGTTFSQNYAYPNATTSASSRLLKIDRRGTCQACHDPTGTILPNTSSGPVPVPYTP
jgi:cytochrome c553